MAKVDMAHLDYQKAYVINWLKSIRENPEREGLRDTPLRVAKLWPEWADLALHLGEVKAFIEGNDYQKNLEVVFTEPGFNDIVMAYGTYESYCEHHTLKFGGEFYVSYLARGKVLGASKLERVVRLFQHNLQTQERLSKQVADSIYKMPSLKPQGVHVLMIGKHGCMVERGVKDMKSGLMDSAVRGVFKRNADARSEVMQMIQLVR